MSLNLKLTDGEKTLALVVLAVGGSAETSALGDFFDRPARLRKAATGLLAKGIATCPANMIRLTIEPEKLVNTLRIRRETDLFGTDTLKVAAPRANGHQTLRKESVPGHEKTVIENVPGRSGEHIEACTPITLRFETLRKNAGKTGAVCTAATSLPSPLPKSNAGAQAALKDLKGLKERHKGIKPLMGLEDLKGALRTLESTGHEMEAYGAMCGILGGVVMEGGDLDRRGKERLGDGGKWLNRWRNSRSRVHSVMAALVEEIAEDRVKSRGGRAEYVWNEFFGEQK